MTKEKTIQTYVGLADSEGLLEMAVSEKDYPTTYYNQALTLKDTCYFKIELSDSEADIIRDLNKLRDSKGGLKACLVFGKGDIEVPAAQTDLWLNISI